MTNTRESSIDYGKITNANCINFIKLRKRETASKKCYFVKIKETNFDWCCCKNNDITHKINEIFLFFCATEAHALEFQNGIMEFGHSRGYMWQG